MSPGASADTETGVPEPICILDECGRETPAAAQAYMVRPEQSNASGPAAAHTYGLPSLDRAAAIATDARSLAGTSDTGGAGTGSTRVSSRVARSSTGWACRAR